MISKDLHNYLLYLADDVHVLGHRMAEWCGHGPILEQDIALTNLALDLIGQARLFYQYAADCISNGQTEDTLAYLRDSSGYRNSLLVELPNGHFGTTISKLFYFSHFKWLQYESLLSSIDKTLAAIAEKSMKELGYHLKFSNSWMIRLGNGTQESHDRMIEATERLWPYTGEWFEVTDFERSLEGEGIVSGPGSYKENWLKSISAILQEATLHIPSPSDWTHSGGKNGRHTEHLGHLLAEMQFLQRSYPGLSW
jgi:ring-1,2-phenylacetyl-CoA epoxidase subunit PaaC